MESDSVTQAQPPPGFTDSPDATPPAAVAQAQPPAGFTDTYTAPAAAPPPVAVAQVQPQPQGRPQQYQLPPAVASPTIGGRVMDSLFGPGSYSGSATPQDSPLAAVTSSRPIVDTSALHLEDLAPGVLDAIKPGLGSAPNPVAALRGIIAHSSDFAGGL